MKNIFKKDKDNKGDKDNKDVQSPLSRSRTGTSTPTLQSSGGGSKKDSDGGGSMRSKDKDKDNDKDKEDAKKQHAIRIGDTRFYGRIICRAKALYDYPLDGGTLQVEDEEIKLLKFKKGDIVNVYEQDTSGWWAGEFNDEKGIFPGSYMKVLEEDVTDIPKGKSKSMTVAREELLQRICELEADREDWLAEQDRAQEEYDKKLREMKRRTDAEISELRKTIGEQDEAIQGSTKKMRAVERELEEANGKVVKKEMEIVTMEIDLQECRAKLVDLAGKQDTRRSEDRHGSVHLKGVQAEIHSKNMELLEINRQRQEAEKCLREAKTKLQAVDAQILKKVMTDNSNERGEDIDMLKKQLGEEVFEKRRMENEIREMKRMCVDVENLKTDKALLERELDSKSELETKLTKIDTILQGLINKDASTLTISSMKELLGKVRKGIAVAGSPGLRTSSIIAATGMQPPPNPINMPSSSIGNSLERSGSPAPAKMESLGRAAGRPKTTSFYKENNG